MRKHWIVRTALVVALGTAPLALAGPAMAANPQGPAYIGACNMLLAVHDDHSGMGHAMMVNNGRGNDGMWRAVDVSGNAPMTCTPR